MGAYASLGALVKLQYQAKGFGFLARQPVHSLLAGRRASRIRGRGLDFEEMRAYLPGDDVRTIDWKATARLGKPYVRVYTEERDRPAMLAVDQRLNMFFGSRRTMKSVIAAETAALSAWRVFHHGDRVGALVFDDESVHEVRPHRSRASVMRILETVLDRNLALRADAASKPAPEMLNRVLQQLAQTAAHDHLIAVISDFDGANEETRKLLLGMAQHNNVLLVLVLDPMDRDLPDTGEIVASDGRLQVEVPFRESRVRKSLLEASSQRIQHILKWDRELGTPVLVLDTAEETLSQLRRILGHAAAARSRG